jgi:hypothetical protein
LFDNGWLEHSTAHHAGAQKVNDGAASAVFQYKIHKLVVEWIDVLTNHAGNARVGQALKQQLFSGNKLRKIRAKIFEPPHVDSLYDYGCARGGRNSPECPRVFSMKYERNIQKFSRKIARKVFGF